MLTLEGQTILITGSARGIGAATARLARSCGANVILHGKSSSPALTKMCEELGAEAVTFDVSDRAETHQRLGELMANRQIDALINNAGWVNPKPFTELTEEDWLKEFSVNLFGMAYVCQAVLPAMRTAGYGRVVNVSSIRGLNESSGPRGVAYSTSKAAVLNLTASLAKEFAPAVNVNAVCPGFIETEMSESWNEAVWKQAQSALVGRVGAATEVANLLLFLASQEASFITGQTFVADGGYSLAGK